MSVKYALLGILAERPCHGYDLKRAFDEKLGDLWNLNYGQIYTTLDRLHADGLVDCDTVAQHDKADRKIYRITGAGLAEFRDWRTRPVKFEPRILRDELFVKLMFMEDDDVDAVLSLIQAQHSVCLAYMMKLTNRKFNIEQDGRRALQQEADLLKRRRIERERLIGMLLIDVALQHAEADIRWLRHVEAKIKGLLWNGNEQETS